MIESKRLQDLGISENEATVLAEVIRNKSPTATQLIQATGMNRKVVYDALRRLSHSALVKSTKQGKERYYSFGEEVSIRALVERDKQATEMRSQQMLAIAESVKKMRREEPVDATVLTGTQGVRVALMTLLDLRSDYVAYGGPLESETVMTEVFWLNFHQKQKALKINVRLLFNNSLKSWLEKIENPHVKIKFLKQIEPLAETIICKDHVIIIIWTSNPSVTILVNSALAKSYRQIFALLWSRAIN